MTISVVPVAAILLDVDGTLLDSNQAHAAAWAYAFQQHGKTFNVERIRPIIGKGSDKLFRELLGIAEDDALAKLVSADRKECFVRSYLPTLRPTKGARALVQRLKSEGLQLVVATSAGADELGALLKQADVDDLIEHKTTSSDANASKPDPDIVQVALRKAGVAPQQAVMLGDTPFDIDAARKADVATIALRCGGYWDDAALAAAAGIYDNPEDLLNQLTSSRVWQGRVVA